MQTKSFQGIKTGCIRKFDPAIREVFRFGGISIGRYCIPGWKMNSAFRILSDCGYGDQLYTLAFENGVNQGLTLFIRRKTDDSKVTQFITSFTNDPNTNYFRFKFVPGNDGITVSLSHSFYKIHDIPVNEMIEGEDKAKKNGKNTEMKWDKVKEFRDSHSFNSLTFPMTDKGMTDLEDAIRRTIEYIMKNY